MSVQSWSAGPLSLPPLAPFTLALTLLLSIGETTVGASGDFFAEDQWVNDPAYHQSHPKKLSNRLTQNQKPSFTQKMMGKAVGK